ncbi:MULTISPECIES: ABC transporter substrate-binding protein [Microbacterium]|jgi:branched-chain amino acid transport system substrate-binding protein|uniref:ABC transporter substrate-binding protein n=1 Tax=Microbacterium TaxID=33882 RepID=UPI001D1759BB|nr:ABC transporter substrate-binding protein [Microbacterium testaceum]MCC4250181.1 ABC transporter substrate-binding protein [Microbacterium testaceum]
MNTKLKASIALALSAATAVSLAGCANGSGGAGGEGDEIVIGRLLPLTGTLAGTGTRVANGSEIARQIINEEGGIDGRQVVFEDVDAPDDDAARQGAERLLNEGIDKVLGTFGSSLALAAIPVITGEGGLYWETGASAVGITDGTYDNVYRTSQNAGDIGTDAVAYATEVLSETLAVDPAEMTVAWAGVNNSYGEDVLAGVKESAAEHNLDVVLEAAYPTDASDLSNVALQIRDANPTVLVLTSYDADAAALARAMRSQDITPPVIIGSGGGHVNEAWIEAMGDSGNGFFNVGFSGQTGVEGLSDAAQKHYAEFYERYAEEHDGAEPGAFDMNGFVGAMSLFEVMKAADDLSAAGVAAAADEIDIAEREFADGQGLSFDENGQNERAVFFVSQWQDGKVVPVFPTDIAVSEPIDVPLPGWDEDR